MHKLTARKEQILQAVIVEYVSGAEPVASEMIVQKYELGVRSATVRNELAEITDLGFLEQPHTSAGRVPSDQGYRYYVDQLVVALPPNAESKERVDSATDEDTLRLLLGSTTKALSRMTHLLAAAATLRNTKLRVRNALFTAMGPQKGLMVLVLDNGHVENRLVDCPAGLTLHHIGQLNDSLRASTDGLTTSQLSRLKTIVSDDPVLTRAAKSITASLRETARDLMRGQLVVEGEEYILSQPEFQRPTPELASFIASMDDHQTLHAAVVGQGVTIGRENAEAALHNLSILRKTFYVGPDEAGTIAIVGPTRLPYDRSLSLLDYTATAISDTLTKLMGRPPSSSRS